VRLVDIPRGAHHIFLSHQTVVVHQVHAFIAGLR
jgi:hypothetical protein